MSSITKSIQNEYVLLMENAFSEKYKYAFRNLELKELRRFILKELISSPELDNQLTNLIVLHLRDEPVTMAGFFMPARRVLRVIVCRIAGANKQNSLSVMAGKGSNLWARSFLACTNPAALTCLLNVLVHLT
ncbi:hypothetical protein SEBLO3795_02255 [Salmonella enterica]|nr:hypothetical protein SEBLO3795_02255 [Salmonella enterica]